MKQFAIFHNDKQVSKAFPFRIQAAVEAVEGKLSVTGYPDFGGNGGGTCLVNGYSIREIPTKNTPLAKKGTK